MTALGKAFVKGHFEGKTTGLILNPSEMSLMWSLYSPARTSVDGTRPMLLAGIKGSSLTEHQGGAEGMGSWLGPLFFPALWTSEVSLRVYMCFPVSGGLPQLGSFFPPGITASGGLLLPSKCFSKALNSNLSPSYPVLEFIVILILRWGLYVVQSGFKLLV